MTIKYYTHNNPPLLKGEVFEKPSLTRQSDFMDIKDTIGRFYKAGLLSKPVYGPLTEGEKEDLFDSVTDMELMDSDLVEQKNFADQINNVVPMSGKVEKDISSPAVEEGADSAKAE